MRILYKLSILIAIMMADTICWAQNVMNPYINTSTITPGSLTITLPFYDPGWGVYTWENRPLVGGYSGEYEIILGRRPFNFYTDPTGWDRHVSYSMEVVSFPFMPRCAFDNDCDVASGNDRFLYMPPATPAYDPVAEKWGNLTNRFYQPNLTNTIDQTLASNAFVRALPLGTNPGNNVLPHSVIKHTVYFHCDHQTNNPPYPPVVYSFSWLYDNTRGRQRFYPPCNCNCSTGCTMSEWDVCFIPELLTTVQHHYNETMDTIILPNGTLNYFPYNEIQPVPACSSYIPYALPTSGQQYSNNAPGSPLIWNTPGAAYPSNIPFPPYSLISSPLYQLRGANIAGYKDVSGTIQAMGGIEHSYFVDRNIDLSMINSSDRVIYNPSQVIFSSSADNFVFPNYYTYQTVRGIYPSPAEVALDDNSDNGGPFADPRDVPVRTDLRCEYTAYPQGTALANSVYASIYKLENLSQVTIPQCVRIFDATFDVKPGGTLIFDDYPNVKNPDRFKILKSTGVVAKNLSAIQYLQDSWVTQPQLIQYKAIDEIHAGDHVDLTEPTGPYSLQSGSNVEFIAGDIIYLQDGFDAIEGTDFHAMIQTVSTNPPCSSFYRTSASIVNEKVKSESAVRNSLFTVYPNPGTGDFTASIKNANAFNLKVCDVFGRTIVQNENQNSKSAIDLSGQPAGIYYFTATENGKQYVEKVIKQ